MFADWMNRNDKPGKLILLDQNPDIAIGKPIIMGAFSELYSDRIELHQGVTFDSVNADTKTIETNKGKLNYGMTSLVLPQQAGGLIRTAGLGERWAKVKFPNFQSAMDERIYVIGDSVGAKLPKSGHLAKESGMRVAQHIADRVADKEIEPPTTMPTAICFASFSPTEAMGVNVTSTWDDFREEISSKPQIQKRSVEANDSAKGWSAGVWNQLLG